MPEASRMQLRGRAFAGLEQNPLERGPARTAKRPCLWSFRRMMQTASGSALHLSPTADKSPGPQHMKMAKSNSVTVLSRMRIRSRRLLALLRRLPSLS